MEPIRRDLLNRETELKARLTKIEADRQRATAPLSADFAEQAVERENDEVLDCLAESTRHQLTQIGRALDRIEGGLYGYCSVCGGLIAPQRLQVLPEATECARCMAQLQAAAG